MKQPHTRIIVSAAWALGTFAAGVAGAVTSLSGWVLLTCLAVGPPIVVLRWQGDPSPSLSESIQEALR
jgi:hypothetical protein